MLAINTYLLVDINVYHYLSSLVIQPCAQASYSVLTAVAR